MTAAARTPAGDALSLAELRRLAGGVPDPELPIVSIADLGILRAVERDPDGGVLVTVTPTYSGCPAMEAIAADIVRALAEHGVAARVRIALAPAWTTDWLTDAARRALAEHGIAPPEPPPQPPPGPATAGPADGPVLVPLSVRCPGCASAATRELSRFGSTACKSLWVCQACGEPFEHLKRI